ncbi:MAG: imidazole glycerol phosphate synthase subunit HisH [Firmicutes bacterium]|nr:imidazole glycerol phosphate synthase subunit HisH [Bacillota bacterium]
MRTAIVRLGVGNLGSLTATLKRLGHQVDVWESDRDVKPADWVIFPGVGSLSSVQQQVAQRRFGRPLQTIHQDGVPALGICLGMQLWFEKGEEGGRGLGWLGGTVPRLSAGILPHVGWNDLEVTPHAPDWLSSFHKESFYFVHSYRVMPEDAASVAMTTDYEGHFPSVIVAPHLYGLQFHPELSGDAGEALLDHIFCHGR